MNEKMVSVGPARGDLLHWNFETVDLAPFLHEGHNVIAAQVWNEGEFRSEANLSQKTGFILQGGTEAAQVLNTNASWKCIQDKAYSSFKVVIPTFIVADPGERMDMNLYVTGWQKSTQRLQQMVICFNNLAGHSSKSGWLWQSIGLDACSVALVTSGTQAAKACFGAES